MLFQTAAIIFRSNNMCTTIFLECIFCNESKPIDFNEQFETHMIHQLSFFTERVWELQNATLKNLVNHTETNNFAEGHLIITVRNKHTGMEQDGLACIEYFDSKTASMFCQFLGYTSGWFENNLNKSEIFQ